MKPLIPSKPFLVAALSAAPASHGANGGTNDNLNAVPAGWAKWSNNLTAQAAESETPAISRAAMVGAGVLALHIAFIWALQNGFLMRAAEVVIPAEMLAQFVSSAAEPVPPQPAPKPPVPTLPKPLVPQKAGMATAAAAPPLKPQPLTINDTTPSVNAPNGETSQPVQSAAAAAPAPAAPTAESAAVTASKIEQPSVDARYSDQDQTVYPAMSRRMGEQGTAVWRVLIGTDGKAVQAQLVKSSGFERLDKAAYDTVMRRRYLPGTRDGVPVALSYNAPIAWVLK